MDRSYDVELVHRQRAIYRVEASDREDAERLAVDRWQRGDPGSVPGYDWSELHTVESREAPDPDRADAEAELVLRFLRERERLILRLGGVGGGPAGNDAISASQVASDLGWTRRDPTGTPVPDVVRATVALERLCRKQLTVCFERPRVRVGERGEIRLYCTPEYLDRLTATAIDGAETQTV